MISVQLSDRKAISVSAECEQEIDGRWIAEIKDVPGAMAYGASRSQAVARAEAVMLRTLADRIEHEESAA